jgi:hypothetical protein
MTRYLNHPRVRPLPWTGAEVKAMKSLIASGLSAAKAAEELALFGFPKRTREAVKNQLARQREAGART